MVSRAELPFSVDERSRSMRKLESSPALHSLDLPGHAHRLAPISPNKRAHRVAISSPRKKNLQIGKLESTATELTFSPRFGPSSPQDRNDPREIPQISHYSGVDFDIFLCPQ